MPFAAMAGPIAALIALAVCAAAARATVVTGGYFDGWLVRGDGAGAWVQVGTGLNRTVYALANYRNTLIAAGSPGLVVDASGDVAHGAAYLDGDTWVSLGGGVSDTTPYTAFGHALATNTALVDGAIKEVLYLAGIFLKAGAVDAKNIAMWDGEAWHALSTGLIGTPYAMTTFRGELIVAGELRQAGGTIVGNIATWDGTRWAPLDDGTDNDIFAVATNQDLLFAGGYFTAASNVPGTNCLAQWDGVAWAPVGRQLTQCAVFSIAVDSSFLIIGGRFVLPGESIATYVAIWDGERFRAAATTSQFAPGTMVQALLPTVDGLYAGGSFISTSDGSKAEIILNGNGSWVPQPTAGVTSDTVAYAFARYNF